LPLLIGKVIGSGVPRVCRTGERGDGRKRAISRLLLFCQRGLFDPGEIGERQPSQDHDQDSQLHRNNIRNFRVHFLSLFPLMCGRRTQSRRESRTNLAENHPAAQSYSRARGNPGYRTRRVTKSSAPAGCVPVSPIILNPAAMSTLPSSNCTAECPWRAFRSCAGDVVQVPLAG